MPKFLIDKLKAQYGQNSKIPYAVANSIGAMHGSVETAKGRQMDAKHARDMAAGRASSQVQSRPGTPSDAWEK